jgi:L-rhamnose mutarotase
MQAASEADPVLAEWEARMWKFQAPTPWTPAGRKWIELSKVFDFRSPPV